MPMPRRMMVPSDEKEGYGKTSLTMTRAMSEDIALKIRKIKKDIDNNKIKLSYSEWQEFVSYCWSDDIWIMAMNTAIEMAKDENLDLNHKKEFLRLISEKSPSELKIEFKKTHPIARLALMDVIDKKPPKPEKPRKYADLWLTPKELEEKYKKEEEEEE